MTVIQFPGRAVMREPIGSIPCAPVWDDVVEAFLDDQRLAGRAKRTVGGHAAELKRLGKWLDSQQLDWRAVATSELKRYCRPRAHTSHSTRSNLFCTLRKFFQWCVEEDYYVVSPVQGDSFKTPTRPKPLPKALTRQQVRQLIDYLAVQERLAARRDEALLLTAIYTGLRASELSQLRWSWVDLDGQVINIRLSKMNKGRAVPLHPACVTMLRQWKSVQGGSPTGPVFTSLQKPGKAIPSGRIGKIAQRVSKESGVEFTTHILRHTFATWALRRSRDLYGVSKSLGHEELKQTEIYVSADPEELRTVVESLFDLDEW